jgi:hypothetical protein
MFAQLVAMGKLITDYKSEADLAEMAEEGIDDDIGVAVEFEDEDEDDDEQVRADPRVKHICTATSNISLLCNFDRRNVKVSSNH